MDNDIITNSLLYYDEHLEKIHDFYEKIYYFKIIINHDPNKKNQIIFMDKNNKSILESDYEYMGIYNGIDNIFKWAWSIPLLEEKMTILSRYVLKYAFSLDPKNDIILRSELITSNIKLYNNYQLDIHSAISAYITKHPFIFPLIVFKDNESIEKCIIENDNNYVLYDFKKYKEYAEKKEHLQIRFYFILNYK